MKRNLLGISLLTIFGLYFLLAAIIILVCLVTDLSVLFGIIISIIILIIQFLISPWLTDLTMKWFYKVDFNYELPAYLKEFITATCEKNGMAYPKVGFINDGSPNAFTYGRTKNDARIVITRGIFELLSEDEAKAVVAHEIGHAVHYDMLFMTVAQLVPLVLYMIYEVCIESNSSSSNDDNGGGRALVAGVAYVLYLLSEYIVLWLSRTREYYADEFSVQATENPNSLASALVKIGFGLVTNVDKPEVDENGKPIKKAKQHSTKDLGALGLFDAKTSKSLIVMTNNNQDDKTQIKNAMKWEMWNPWAFFYQLQSTHPLISKRLLAISKYSPEYGQEPYIVFDLQKPESYVDDFAFELLIKLLPTIICVVGFFLAIFMFVSNDDLALGRSIAGGTIILASLASLLLFRRTHKTGYTPTNVANLLSEVKVSGVTSVSCELEGEIIGRGNPGYMFNEDFMIKDDTGIIFADYNTPLWILNKIFALFKNGQNIGKRVKIKGWYRRSPVPYVEIFNFEIDGQVHKTGIYTFNLIFIWIGVIVGLLLFLSGFIV